MSERLDNHPRPTTAEEWIGTRTIWFPHHQCGGCSEWVGWAIINGKPHFSTRCNCTHMSSPLRPDTWDEVAEFYNMQRHPKAIASIAEQWDLPDPFAEPHVDVIKVMPSGGLAEETYMPDRESRTGEEWEDLETTEIMLYTPSDGVGPKAAVMTINGREYVAPVDALADFLRASLSYLEKAQ